MKLAALCKRIWQWLRAVTGDAAYESYVRHTSRISREATVLSPRDFYLDQLRRRYNTINRCC
jgi:uncharacterized short protein YbdD (DUF466 family)